MRRLVFLLALTACGDDPVRHLDGGIDATPDAPDPGSPVTLTITTAGTGIAGVRVWFQAPDSTLISSTMTDASGVASAVMPIGGFVTAVDPFTGPGGLPFNDVRTFAGVKGGDHLTLKESLGSLTTAVTVTGPAENDGTVVDFLFSTPCGETIVTSPGSGSTPTAQLDFYGDCLTSTDVLIASRDAAGEIVHWLYAPNVTPTGATLDLSAMALTNAPTSKTFTYTNIPVSIPGEIYLEQTLGSTKGRVATFLGVTTSGTATIKLPAFTNAVDTVTAEGRAQYGRHLMIDWGAFAAATTVDIGARALPEITSLPAFDVAGHRIGWTSTGGQTPDFTIAIVSAQRTSPLMGWNWMICAPYTSGELVLPTLPVETVDFNVAVSDIVDLQGVALGKVPGGYDAVRKDLQNLDTGPTALINSPSGSITVEELSTTLGVIGKAAGNPRTIGGAAWNSRRRM